MNDGKTKEAVAELVREFISSNTGLSGTATSGVKERRGRRRQLILSRALATRHLRASTKKRLRRDGRHRQYLLRGAYADALAVASYDDPYEGGIVLEMGINVNGNQHKGRVRIGAREVAMNGYSSIRGELRRFIADVILGEGIEYGGLKRL